MNKKGLSNLLEPSFQLYFVVLALFALVTAVAGKYLLAVAEALVIFVLFLYFRRRDAQRRRDILNYIENISGDIDMATKDTVVNAPLPMVIFRPDTGEIVWSNNLFLHITGEKEHLFDRKISEAVPDFDARWLMEGKSQCPTEIHFRDHRYQVFGRLVRTEDQGRRRFLATTYWVDDTEFSTVRDEFYGSRPVVALLVMDNYDEVFKGVSDSVKAAMTVDVNRRLTEWAAPSSGMFFRYDRDRFMLVFEERYLPAFIENKFDILDKVREVLSPGGQLTNRLPATGRPEKKQVSLEQRNYLNNTMQMW